ASAAAPLSRRPFHELLRRPASVLLRQRGESDGQRQAGLPGRESPPLAALAECRRGRRQLSRPPESRFARRGPRSAAPNADYRRGGIARADRGAALPARPVLPHAEL